jgi:hypothetical protein
MQHRPERNKPFLAEYFIDKGRRRVSKAFKNRLDAQRWEHEQRALIAARDLLRHTQLQFHWTRTKKRTDWLRTAALKHLDTALAQVTPHDLKQLGS